jgi:hypothetical protein
MARRAQHGNSGCHYLRYRGQMLLIRTPFHLVSGDWQGGYMTAYPQSPGKGTCQVAEMGELEGAARGRGPRAGNGASLSFFGHQRQRRRQHWRPATWRLLALSRSTTRVLAQMLLLKLGLGPGTTSYTHLPHPCWANFHDAESRPVSPQSPSIDRARPSRLALGAATASLPLATHLLAPTGHVSTAIPPRPARSQYPACPRYSSSQPWFYCPFDYSRLSPWQFWPVPVLNRDVCLPRRASFSFRGEFRGLISLLPPIPSYPILSYSTPPHIALHWSALHPSGCAYPIDVRPTILHSPRPGRALPSFLLPPTLLPPVPPTHYYSVPFLQQQLACLVARHLPPALSTYDSNTANNPPPTPGQLGTRQYLQHL